MCRGDWKPHGYGQDFLQQILLCHNQSILLPSGASSVFLFSQSHIQSTISSNTNYILNFSTSPSSLATTPVWAKIISLLDHCNSCQNLFLSFPSCPTQSHSPRAMRESLHKSNYPWLSFAHRVKSRLLSLAFHNQTHIYISNSISYHHSYSLATLAFIPTLQPSKLIPTLLSSISSWRGWIFSIIRFFPGLNPISAPFLFF